MKGLKKRSTSSTAYINPCYTLTLFLYFSFSYINSNAQLTAKFSFVRSKTCIKTNVADAVLVSFVDESTGGSHSTEWSFGNGGGSLQPNPSSTYLSPGVYYVTLTIKNPVEVKSITQQVVIFPEPVINFTSDVNSGCIPLNVKFTDLTSDLKITDPLTNRVYIEPIISRTWSFGDGKIIPPSVSNTIIYKYDRPGTKDVGLTILSEGGCTVVKSPVKSFVNVFSPADINFLLPPPTACQFPLKIQPVNNSASTTKYKWSGTGPAVVGISDEAANEPTLSFPQQGTYTVKLIGTTSEGCVDSSEINYFVPPTSIISSFTGPKVACENSTLNYTNTSSPDPISNKWFINDVLTSSDKDLSHLFANAGNYTVKLESQIGGCIAKDSIKLVVNPLPIPSFTSSSTVSCTPPFSVDFFDNSSGQIVKKIWEFGDGNNKTELVPFSSSVTNTYNREGQFSVRLTVVTDKGCAASKFEQNLVRVTPPRIIKKNLPDSGCLPFTIIPDIQFENPSEIATWDWEYKDKGKNVIYTSNLSAPLPFTLSNATDSGQYLINLNVTNSNGCITPFSWIIRAGNKPKAFDFDVSPIDDCANKTFTFSYKPLAQDSITGYKWIFNSTDTVPGKIIKKDFKEIGSVNVDLLVYQYGCPNLLQKANFLDVKGVVSIFSVLNDCTTPLDRVIVDNSIGNIQNWLVDYGDGNTDNFNTKQSSFRHTYAKSGKYTISVKVSDGNCSYIDSAIVRVVDNNINFKFGKLPLCVSDTFMTLTALVNNPEFIKSYNWEFDCGFTSATANGVLKVSFSSLCKNPNNFNRGSYKFKLMVLDTNNCITPYSDGFFVGGPVAKIAPITSITGCNNLPVSFKDNTTGDGVNAIVSKAWSFGDGSPTKNILTGPITHSFSGVGRFPVTLAVTDQSGCQSFSDTITVTTSDPDVDFISFNQFSCLNKPVQFEAKSSVQIADYTWDFGDGFFGSTKSPKKTYSSIGLKTIKLTIKDLLGCVKTVSKPNYITIDMPNVGIAAIRETADCPPFNAEFRFTGSYADFFEWDFGDGSTSTFKDPNHLYLESGSYLVNLKITSPGGCTAVSSTALKIQVNGPRGSVNFKPTICEPYIAQFNINPVNTDFVIIDYGDGNISGRLPVTGSYSYKYTDTGQYQPSIFLQNNQGCNVFIKPPNAIKTVVVEPKFTSDINFMCDGGKVVFTDRSYRNEPISAWNWDFGDGKKGTGASSFNNYDKPGFYNVKLNVTTQSGCQDSLTRRAFIEVQARPDIGFTVDKPVVCEDDLIQFNAFEVTTNNSPVVSWFWDFTNGKSSTLKNPLMQPFRKAGVYPLRLYVTNSKGCLDTLVQNFIVNANPTLDAGQDVNLCLGTPVQLSPQGAITYQWDNGPAISCLNCERPFVNPTKETVYRVRGFSSVGCSAVDSVMVRIVGPTTVRAMKDTFVCEGESVQLLASGTSLYNWSPSTGLNRNDISSPVARPTQTTTYVVTGSDPYNCFVTRDDILVRFVPKPKISAGSDTTIMAGYPYALTPTYSNDVSRVQWKPSSFLNCGDCKFPKSTPSYSTTYTLFAYTSEGCMSNDAVNIFVTCTKENLFIPNTFSPNGDGINEIFYPRGRGVEKIKSMKIFSRWGQLLYEKTNFLANDVNAGWNGRQAGQVATSDVYVYMLELVCENGNVITLKGDVTLVR